jgi:Methyltransferase domain
MKPVRKIVAPLKEAVPSPIASLAHRWRLAARLTRDPRAAGHLDWLERGLVFAERWPATATSHIARGENPFRAFFDARSEGRGIWKWDHYFDLYNRHLRKFVGTEVHVLEIGVSSGGSLEMWRTYFGPRCHLYGVDIEQSCKQFEDDSTRIFIADQANRDFWHHFRDEVPSLDVVVDDGGHRVEQQVATLEELLPHLRAGGVYVCEDVHGAHNWFGAYASGLVQALDASAIIEDRENPERRLVSRTTGFQAFIDSVHSYPFAIVIERRATPVTELVAPQHGDEWKPFRR